MVEVNQAGTLTADDFTPDGKINPVGDPVHQIGDLVVRFEYDGLGRLMCVQRPVSGDPPDPVYRTEHYYYDGVRRVQEVDDNATPTTAGDDETRHEYVYGPDYVDEFVLESQKTVSGQQPFYILQDANYNVMALLDDTGAVVEQYQWEPYGSLATLDSNADPRPPNSLGHQGLFFYRLNPQTGDTATLSTTAVGLYFNRNRWYSPHLGRFMTRDPRGTSMPGFAQPCPQSAFGAGCDCEVPKIEECQGCGCGGGADCSDSSSIIEPCEAGSCFDDGMNVYSYVESNPVLNVDPAGTSALALGKLIATVTGAAADFGKAHGDIVRGVGISSFLAYLIYRFEQAISNVISDIVYARTDRIPRPCRLTLRQVVKYRTGWVTECEYDCPGMPRIYVKSFPGREHPCEMAIENPFK